MPDVILVRKYYATKGDRKWMLKNFESDVNEAVKLSAKEQEAMEEDYEEFLQTVEADRDMRKNIRLYKASSSSGGADRDSSHETRSQKRASGSSSKRTKTDAGGPCAMAALTKETRRVAMMTRAHLVLCAAAMTATTSS